MHQRTLVLLTQLAVAGALALPAVGQAADRRTASRPLGFGIAPVNAKRPYFVLPAKRGAVMKRRVRLTNTTGRTLTAVLRPADATTAATGGVDFGTRSPNGDGTWLSLSQRLVRLKPYGDAEVSFTVRIPADATAGDHFAGITSYNNAALALLHRQQRSKSDKPFAVKAITRLAVAIQFQVPGPTHAALRAGRAAFSAQPSGTTVALPVRNTGNLMIPRTTGRLTLSQGTRILRRLPVRITTFIPDTQITIPLPVTGTPVEGTYRLQGVLRPQGAQPVQIDTPVIFGATQSKAVKQATGQEAIAPSSSVSKWLIATLVIALLVALITVVMLLRSIHRPRNGKT